MNSLLQYKLQESRIMTLRQPSDYFDVIVPSEEYQALRDEVRALQEQKKLLLDEVQLLRQSEKRLRKEMEKWVEYPERIAHLSRTVLRMGKVIIELRESSQRLTRDAQMKGKLELQGQKWQEREEQWQRKLGEARQCIDSLCIQRQKLTDDVKSSEVQKKKVEQEVVKQEKQLVMLRAALEQQQSHMETMKQQKSKLQEQLKEKDILILNERHLLEEQAKQLKRYQQILELKSKEIVKKYQDFQIQKSDYEQTYNKKMQQLESKYEKKQQQRQQKYEKQIASLRSYNYQDEGTEKLHEQLAKYKTQAQRLKQQLTNARKKIKKWKDLYQHQNSMVQYLNEIYKKPQNNQNSLFSAQINELKMLRDKLHSSGENNIMQKMTQRKDEMVSQLDNQFRKLMDC